jgi:hypothetical protein
LSFFLAGDPSIHDKAYARPRHRLLRDHGGSYSYGI